MSEIADVHQGSCNCRAVRFSTLGPLRGVIYCHCGQCRKQSGHYLAATSVPVDRLTIDGEDEITWYAASSRAQRGFCRRCGSSLFWKRSGGTHVSILAGAFETPSGLTELRHIFVAEKGDYYDLADDLPALEQDHTGLSAQGTG